MFACTRFLSHEVDPPAPSPFCRRPRLIPDSLGGCLQPSLTGARLQITLPGIRSEIVSEATEARPGTGRDRIPARGERPTAGHPSSHPAPIRTEVALAN